MEKCGEKGGKNGVKGAKLLVNEDQEKDDNAQKDHQLKKRRQLGVK